MKKVPIRKCVGCNQRRPKNEMIRVVRCEDGNIILDFKGKINGRGAYICPEGLCFEKARKDNKLAKEFEQNITSEVYDRLEEQLSENKKISGGGSIG